MEWHPHARALADRVAPPGSRWQTPIADTPRHVFVPAWWKPGGGTWTRLDGPTDPGGWLAAAYADRTLVTQVGPLHADHAAPDDQPVGRPTSSSTLPGLVVQMLRHAAITDACTVLDVGTGSGYGTAVLCERLSAAQVTSVDVDAYLTKAAEERLAEIGHRPRILTSDATGPLPGEYDRIVSMVSVRPIPASWLAVLPVGGRLATTITNTTLLITATKTDDGGAVGQVERDRAMFMTTRSGADYPPRLASLVDVARTMEGDDVAVGRFPVLDVVEAWEVRTMLELAAPDIEHHHEQDGETRTAVMVHADGSWARATSTGRGLPIIHQSGPRRLWDLLDEVRDYWLQHGELPLHAARVHISPDGVITLRRGRWTATIGSP
ncbi:methyltransferase domain-containing protein [Streptosporangium sp. NPDC048865]|uniref:methyltransferase domain-containing protein n=1 Tax=Streptosporangium sp. NPDC048865 TaxID=3155766 RepID=UPI00343E15AA